MSEAARERLIDFVRESNRIEGILREPTDPEVVAHEHILSLDKIAIDDLVSFVQTIQPNAILRDRPGLNVRVGNHIAPPGGCEIPERLDVILSDSHLPWRQHVEYETLHPFTDGNGRSGRVLWLHSMGGVKRAPLGFLHHFYYQTLSHVGQSPTDRDGDGG